MLEFKVTCNPNTKGDPSFNYEKAAEFVASAIDYHLDKYLKGNEISTFLVEIIKADKEV
jgi:hypothetical protein